jgi:hypothetical protein
VNKGVLNHAFSWLDSRPRSVELLMEDLLGFGLLRFMIDGIRGLIYGTGEFNWTAARERGMRESLSILTDIFIPAWSALGIGAVAGGLLGHKVSQLGSTPQAFTKAMVPATSMRLFQHVSKDAHSLDAVLDNLTQTLTEWRPNAEALPLGKQHVTTLRSTLADVIHAKDPKHVAELGIQLAKKLGLTQLDGILNIPDLQHDIVRLSDGKSLDILEDFRLWVKSLPEKARHGPWTAEIKEAVHNGLKKGLSIRGWQLGGLLVGLVTTMASPLLITAATRWLDHRNDYPALMGLTRPPEGLKKEEVKKTGLKGWFQRQFPYVSQQLSNGNPLPLLGALIPMAVGLCFDTVNMRLMKPNRKFLMHLLDFGKQAPQTMQQQLATLYAFLITSRMLSTREPIEYRERAVDSVLGWSMWILGTPALTRLMAGRATFPKGLEALKDALFKKTGPWNQRRLRSVEEITQLTQGLSESQIALLKDTRIAVGRKALLLNIGLLGLVEPLFSTFWSQNSVEAKAKKAWAPVIQRLLQHPN